MVKAGSYGPRFGGYTLCRTEDSDTRLWQVCAETCLKPVFKAISHLIKRYQNKKKMIRIYNKFVEMDPARWSDAYDMSINVGLGSGFEVEMMAAQAKKPEAKESDANTGNE